MIPFMTELAVTNLERSLHFYRDGLGLSLDLHDPVGLFARLQGRIALKERTSASTGVSLHFEVDCLDAVLSQWSKRGIVPDGPVTVSEEGYRRAIFHDPDGIRVIVFEWLTSPPPGVST